MSYTRHIKLAIILAVLATICFIMYKGVERNHAAQSTQIEEVEYPSVSFSDQTRQL